MIKKESMEKFIKECSYLYCAENKFDEKGRIKNKYINKKIELLGKRVRLGCSTKAVEQIAYDTIESKESPCPTITRNHIAWKAGRLKVDEGGKYTWDGKNGMGNTILNIDSYLEMINKNRSEICKMLDNGDIKLAYEKLLKLNMECGVKQLGAVYLITIIFFMSKGKYPIYDKFAHKAALAIRGDKNPLEVSVKPAPDKTSISAVMKMYDEYLYLLNDVIGTTELSRGQDQALWVYGHSKVKYNFD